MQHKRGIFSLSNLLYRTSRKNSKGEFSIIIDTDIYSDDED